MAWPMEEPTATPLFIISSQNEIALGIWILSVYLRDLRCGAGHLAEQA
jgi:hypothetical protein